MSKCEDCLNHVPVISENGMHYNCSLAEDKTMECISGVEDHSFIVNPGRRKLDEPDRQTT